MISLSPGEFESLTVTALKSLDSFHANAIKNIAIIYEMEPSLEQREKLKLRDDQTLFGLYEGLPLPNRQGVTRIYPDKITIFQGPLQRASKDIVSLKENIRHTLWHEIAHYYGLDHQKISQLE